MLKILNLNLLKSNAQLLKLSTLSYVIKKRNFLSEAYYCKEVWNSRLKSALLQKVNLEELYRELDQTYQNTKNLSAIDVDVFVNTVDNDEYIQEVRDILHKLRLSADCVNMLPSTGHAVNRLFLTNNKTDELLDIIDDRLNYGVFLDYYDGNILMNTLIKNKSYASAARVATQFMLQEDFEHDLNTKLAALSCYLYLKNPVGWPEPPPPEPEPTEEIKIRVKFLRNPYFDDHFDLREPNHLIGKTLAMIGSKNDSTLFNTLKVLGLALYEKNEELTNFITKLKKENKSIYKEILDILVKNEEIVKQISELQITEGNIQKELENQVRASEKNCAERDIDNQCKLYFEWENKRMQALQQQAERLGRIKKLENVEDIQKSLKEQEQKLWFFENEEKLELQIDANTIYYRKRWFGKKKKPRVIDEDYIPPEAVPRRSK